MIRVHKDLNRNIPNSLIDNNIIRIRELCIENQRYDKKFNNRYKQTDTKESLKKIYNQKCAFCEQKITKCIDNNQQECSSTVEHYRPKSIYYWLAFSWDNLLWCCHRCNQNKDNSFEIENSQIEYDEVFKDDIHSSASSYHSIEKPFMIHPELESVLNKLTFVNGIIDSTDSRVQYTIDTCKLNRADLNEKRLAILKSFVSESKKRNRLKKSYKDILDNLKKDFMNEKSEFRALKYWILMNHKSLVEEN